MGMAIFEKYVNQKDFTSYEDFKENFRICVPEKFNFAYDVLDKLAEEKPDQKALVWCNEEDDERIFTFAEMKRYSDKAANLFKNAGIKKGDSVMLVLKRHYQFWYVIMALHKLGAVAVPATHLLTAKDIVYRCNRADVKAVICTTDHDFPHQVDIAEKDSPTLKLKYYTNGSNKQKLAEKVKMEQEGRIVGWTDLDEAVEAQSEHFERPQGCEDAGNEDNMLLYFTSGTSGYPKMVVHTFSYPLGHIITAGYWHSVKEQGLHLTVAETGWAKAVWGKLYGQWLGESTIFVYDMEKFNPPDLLGKISKYQLTTFCAPPTIYRFMIKEDLSQYDLSSLKELTVAGEALNPEVYNQIYKAMGLKLRECYGQTEVVALVCTFPWMKIKPGSMGKPSPCYDVDIVDNDYRSCYPGEVGEIVINTSKGTPVGMFKGYHKDEELTQEVWHDGFYHTGDLAYKDEDGYYWYVGRKDDVIKSSGYRIGPFEVESALMEHPSVLECAVTGVPDDLRGQLVKATIVLARGYEPSEELKKELQNYVKKATAPYKYPRIVEFVTELPKTISGKIRRVEIREHDQKKETVK